jgi:hypothetical protein
MQKFHGSDGIKHVRNASRYQDYEQLGQVKAGCEQNGRNDQVPPGSRSAVSPEKTLPACKHEHYNGQRYDRQVNQQLRHDRIPDHRFPDLLIRVGRPLAPA